MSNDNMTHHMTPEQVIELREAAHDFASLIMVENFPKYDMAAERAYERLRKALEVK